MRLVLNNIVFSQQKAGGISLLWSELVKYILHCNIKCFFIEYTGSDLNIYRKNIDISKVETKQYKYNKIFSLLPKSFIKIKKDNYVCLSSDYNICKSKRIGNVIVVHDFINEFYEKRIFVRLFKKYYKKRAIFFSDAIICVSDNTQKDLIKIYPKIDISKIHVVHNCVSKDYKVLNDLGDYEVQFKPFSYVVFVGRRKGYKNFKIVVEALHKYSDMNLVIVGGGKLLDTEVTQLQSKIGSSRFSHISGVNNHHLNVLYNYAYALIYPSEYEGFGIPIIEAQAAGCPVITSKNSSLQEVGGLGCVYIDDNTSASIDIALQKLEDEDLRKNIIRLGLINKNKFSPAKMAGKYIAICDDIFNKKFSNDNKA